VSQRGDQAHDALAGLRIVAFEARRADELARLLARRGAVVTSAPALRETPLGPSPALRELVRAARAGEVACLVLLTGVGTRALARAIADDGGDPIPLLQGLRLVARGPKPLAALRELGVGGAVPVPSPHTWREAVGVIDALALPARSRIAVQEYGTAPTGLLDALAERSFDVLSVPVYRWELPADPSALRDGVAALQDDAVDVAVFTSAAQVEHVVRVAGDPARLRDAFRRVVVASIGPVCSEALDAHGILVDLEADPPKLGPLVALLAANARVVLEAKRTS